jgi:hypothetical protein
MRLYTGLTVVLITISIAFARGQNENPYAFLMDMTEQVHPDSLARTILDLEAFVSRHSLNSNRTEVAAYIRSRLESYGCDVEIDTFPYVDTYSGLTFEQYNVIGKIYGFTNLPPVLIGAHHDSCCRTDSSPGADDNASGVAAVIEAARIFSQSGFSPRRTVYFGTWAAEEQGLHGSKNYARKLKLSGVELDLAINLDMIATNRSQVYKVNLEMSSEISEQALIFSGLNGNLSFVQGASTGNSDHASFRQFGYPILYFHEFDFSAHYHTPRDLFIHLDMNYCSRVSQASLANLAAFAHMLEKPNVVTAGNSGTGSGIYAEWLPVEGAMGYRVKILNNANLLLDTTLRNGLSLHYEGLSVSYARLVVTALDSLHFEGKSFEKNIQLSSVPSAIAGLTSAPQHDEIILSWQKPSETDLREVILMKRNENQPSFDTLVRLNPGLSTFNVYLENSETHYFKLQAVDTDGNYGSESAVIGSALARFDRGLLVISDATANPFGFSTDSVTRFFEALDSIVPTTVMRANNAMPNIFKAFSMILWHSTKASLSQKLEKNLDDLTSFVQSGGGLIVSTDYPQKLISVANQNTTSYPSINPVHSFMHISQTNYVNNSYLEYAKSATAPILRVDPGKVSASMSGNIKEFSGIEPVSPLVPMYRAFTASGQNQMNNRVVGMVSFGNPKLCVLGVPLFFFRHEDVGNFIRHIAEQGFYSSIPNQALSNKSFEYYPNPAGNELNVRFQDGSKNMIIEVFNLQGIKLLSMEKRYFDLPEKETIILDVSRLSAGAYLIKINNQSGLFFKH